MHRRQPGGVGDVMLAQWELDLEGAADRHLPVLKALDEAENEPGDALRRGTPAEVDDRLREWDYGAYEGRTTQEIRVERPGWYLWRDGVPGGESVERVGARADAVLDRVRPSLAGGDVVLASHAHLLRVLTARWLRLPPDAGRLFRLDTGTLSTLGTEHDEPVMQMWNAPPVPRR